MTKFKKTILVLITIFLFVGGLSFTFLDKIREHAKKNLPPQIKNFVKEKLFGKELIEELSYLRMSDYNQAVLPETQFEIMSLNQVKINGLSNNSSYVKLFNSNLIVIDRTSRIE